jgi:hypothetical protein
LIFRLFPIFSNGFWNCSEDVVYLYLFIVVYILSMIIYTVCVGADVNTFSLLEYFSQQPENCENRNDPDLVQAFLKKWWVESDFKVPNLPLSLLLKGLC